ncbi:MAG: hypothetical protein AAF357_14095 [Verrucomicrobiota bacterium]
MSQMHQMQLTYVPTEDRIMFRMNTKSRQEFRFWMTRRYLSILWKTLSKLIADRDEAKDEQVEKEAEPVKDIIVESGKKEIKHKEMVSKSDFKTQYQESSYLPLGEEPALLFGVGVKPNSEGQSMLCMHPEKGKGIELVLNEQILHSLCKLIIDTSTRAQWNLDLTFVAPPEDVDEPPTGLN